jgi:hypothetical protein
MTIFHLPLQMLLLIQTHPLPLPLLSLSLYLFSSQAPQVPPRNCVWRERGAGRRRGEEGGGTE